MRWLPFFVFVSVALFLESAHTQDDLSCCDVPYGFGFSVELVRSGKPFDGILDASALCHASGAELSTSGSATVYANIIASAENDVQGHSLSIEVTDDVDIVSARSVDDSEAFRAGEGGRIHCR